MSDVSPQQRPTSFLGAEDRDILSFLGIRTSIGERRIGAGLQGKDSGKSEWQNRSFDYHAEEFSLDFGASANEGL